MAPPRGAASGAAGPRTVIPWPARNEAKARAASAAGVNVRGRKLPGSSASWGAPLAVSRPWSTSSDSIGVTLPLVT